MVRPIVCIQIPTMLLTVARNRRERRGIAGEETKFNSDP